MTATVSKGKACVALGCHSTTNSNEVNLCGMRGWCSVRCLTAASTFAMAAVLRTTLVETPTRLTLGLTYQAIVMLRLFP
jgi:uncharacterized protein YraI